MHNISVVYLSLQQRAKNPTPYFAACWFSWNCNENWLSQFKLTRKTFGYSSKRAGWRYAQDRASVASRWTWLTAQISDLEYKIRQHNDLQRQLRASKGAVLLEATVSAPTVDATINGYSGLLPGASSTQAMSSAIPTIAGASRTRPFAASLYRKRKLVRLAGLHEVSKKAARAASIRCSCDGTLPDAVCALCTGRKEPTIGQEPFDLMSVQSRIGAVDPGFHPVLSMPDGMLLPAPTLSPAFRMVLEAELLNNCPRILRFWTMGFFFCRSHSHNTYGRDHAERRMATKNH